MEINFDGLVGNTHHYAGLSFGNIASQTHGGKKSNPKKALLQGISKMRTLVEHGVPQAVLPPHLCPRMNVLRSWGFAGTDAQILDAASKRAPLLSWASSGAAMWTANAATVIPSSDSLDSRVHLVVANLGSTPHRALESKQTERALRSIFGDASKFQVHRALAYSPAFGDEGAANHTLLEDSNGTRKHVFVFGKQASSALAPRKYPARQSLEASQAVARIAQLPQSACLFLQQSPEAIDAGVFHNDVISTGHLDVFLAHEKSFAENDAADLIRAHVAALRLRVISEEELSLAEAVRTYFFNSQIVDARGGRFLIAPQECAESKTANALIERLINEGLLDGVVFCDLRESMQNGGGPACLRLRVQLTDAEAQSLSGAVLMNEARLQCLEDWAKKHYRDELSVTDLRDPQLIEESRTAAQALMNVLELPTLYDASEL